MLSPETLETYKRMTPSERLQLTFDLMRGCEQALLQGSAEQVARKFELLRRENDFRCENMLKAIAKTRVAS